MNYEMFKRIVKENFLSYMPEEYRGATIEIRPRKKVNQTMDALMVYKDNDSRIFPSIYVNEMYEHYKGCDNLEAVLCSAAASYIRAMDKVKSCELDVDIEHFKDKVIMCLINTEQNRELLADVPNREFHDLSVIYRWIVESIPNSVSSTIVTNNIVEKTGMTEEELFQYAVKNTRCINPVSVMSMSEAIDIMSDDIGVPQEIKEEMEQVKYGAEDMWLISNSTGIYGAASMLYEENLHHLAEKLGDNFFILPSSIHEVIAIPAKIAEKNLAHLTEMVQTINMESLKLEERLSNSVYFYDKELRKVILAAEVPGKRLDGKKTETPMIQEDERLR